MYRRHFDRQKTQGARVAGRSHSHSNNLLSSKRRTRKVFLFPPGEGMTTLNKQQRNATSPLSPSSINSNEASSQRRAPSEDLPLIGQKRRASSPPSGEDVPKRKRKDGSHSSLTRPHSPEDSDTVSVTYIDQNCNEEGKCVRS
jgi:hypothetical protein